MTFDEKELIKEWEVLNILKDNAWSSGSQK